MEGMFYGCSRLKYINIVNLKNYNRISTMFVSMFDQNIPHSGKIIANENFITLLNKTYITEWDIAIS